MSATDSRITTVSYDADTGAEEWAAVWDGRPDGVDAGKTVRLSPDGRTVVVGGVTSVASGDLDYVLLGYDARTGDSSGATRGRAGPRRRPVRPGRGRQDRLRHGVGRRRRRALRRGLPHRGARPPGRDAPVERALRRDRQTGQSDRANAIAVDKDGVYVTGDSRGTGSTSAYDYATVAYDLDGNQRWVSRYAGPTAGFNSPVAIAADGGTVVVTGQSRGETADDVRRLRHRRL